jgi:F-type H+-transporting ATPase subunit delta
MALAIANRYARALADVLGRPISVLSPEDALAQLQSFENLLTESAELKNALLSPAVDSAKKRAIIRALGEPLGLSEPIRNFLYIVINHKRVELLDSMIASYRSWLDDSLGIARLEVTSAQRMDDALQKSLLDTFGRVTGLQVRAKFHEDPELLGGAVVRHGSTLYDGSLRAQLNALDHALAGGR